MKKLAIGVSLLLCLMAGLGVYLYHLYGQITHQPSWYDGRQPSGQPVFAAAGRGLEQRILKELKGGKTVTLPADQLIALVAAHFETRTGLRLDRMVKAVRTTVTPSGIEIEMMVDVLELPTDQFPPDVRDVLDRVTRTLPKKALKDLYVRSRLNPSVNKGVIGLDPTSGFSVGKIPFSLAKIEELLGKKADFSIDSLPVGAVSLAKNAVVLAPLVKGGRLSPGP